MLPDTRLALRQLRLNPGYSVIAIVVIALGIGANTAIFSIIDAVILKPLPYAEPDRLVMLWETRPDRGGAPNVVSAANYLDWKARNTSFDAMSAILFRTGSITGAGEPEEIRLQLIAEDFFPMLGISPAHGRNFTRDECQPGAPLTAILSDQLWQRKFAADPSIVGRTIRLNSDAVTVVGIAPPRVLTIGDRPPELWLALRIRGVSDSGARASGRNFSVLARLKPGANVVQADAEMKAMAKQLEQEYPQFNSNWSAMAVPLTSEMYGKTQTPLFILLGAVGCVLLIACANVANLLLTRAAGREQELAVRVSLGASPWRIMRQLLAESMTLAVIGGVLGIVLGAWLIQVIKAVGPADIRRLDRAGLDAGVLAFTALLIFTTGILLGLAPALASARRTLSPSLREGGRGSTGGVRMNRLRDLFTVAEVALSLILLVGAGLLLRSFARLTAVEPGFRTDHVPTANISLPGARYRDQKDVQFFAELGRRVRALPGVVNASTITFLPFKGMGSGTYFWRDDKPKPAPGQEPVTDVRMVQARYFETMNIPLRRGRTFTEADNDPKTPLRFVVNDTMARQMFPNEDPIGRRLVVQMRNENPPGEIIGVVGDIRHGSLADKVRPMVYYPQAHLSFGFGTLVVHTSVDPLSLSRSVAGVVHELDPQLPVSEVGTMQRWVDESLSRTKFQTGLLAVFAGLALALALLGIYGVMSYGVAQRTHEIGVRMALGAQRGHIARMILWRGFTLTFIGLALGLAGAFALGRYLETLLYEIRPADPLTLISVTAVLIIVALLAAFFPAQRAARVDPMVALRYE
jgi:putative ABC transport system permease protein